MMIRWTLPIFVLMASACVYGESLPSADDPPPLPNPPTTLATPVPFDAEAFVADHIDDLFTEIPALVVVFSANTNFENVVNELPEVVSYSVEYVGAFARREGLAEPETELVAIGLWAAYPDTDVGLWIESLRSRFPVLAALPGAQYFDPVTISSRWQPIASLELASGSIRLAASYQHAMIVTSEAAWLIDQGQLPQEIAYPPTWSAEDWRLVGAGDRFVAFNDGDQGAIFAADSWSVFETISGPGRFFGASSIVDRFFVVTAPTRNEATPGIVLELDLTDGTWTELATVPEAINVGDVVAVDGSIVVSGTRQGANNNLIGDTQPGVHIFDIETLTWTTIQDAPISGQAASVGGSGPYLLAWNYDMQYSVHPPEPEKAWSLPKRVPLDEMECYPRTVSGPQRTVANFCGQLAVFATGEWSVLPTPPGTVAATSNGIWSLAETERGRYDVFYLDLKTAGSGADE
jgi:hypothetical protein